MPATFSTKIGFAPSDWICSFVAERTSVAETCAPSRRADAIACAYRLIAHGVKPEDRVALVAETGADFAMLFFGIVYAGAWPVPLP